MTKKILLIDDEELVSRTLVKGLERNKYEVMVAKNGNDALIMAEEEDFDLVISDIKMPGPNGIETVQQIEEIIKSKEAQKIPVIFITGYAGKDIDEEKIQSLNPCALIYKPIDYEDFIKKVKKALEA